MTNSGKWGLCLISIGCIFVMVSQTSAEAYSLIAVGITAIIGGTIIALKGRIKK
ncbi:MAG: hypothetical protein R3Y47_01650 [Lachnospiraceae bacterium]